MVVFLVLLSIVIDKRTSHPKIGYYGRMLLLFQVVSMEHNWHVQNTHRIFPQNKVTGIPQTQITASSEPLSDIAPFAQFSARLVFLLFGSAHFAKVKLNI
jgi:hypothetical protein